MPAYYDESTKTWYCKFYYTDYTGTKKQKKKRGFKLQREAKEWERAFLEKQQADVTMPFEKFTETYFEDMSHRLREHTIIEKKYVVNLKLIPYFGKLPLNEITPANVRKWQNTLMDYRDDKGNPYSETYLKMINNQLTAIFNYAVRYYGLRENPCRKAGSMGKSHAEEMQFWTRDEFKQFCAAIEDKPQSKAAFLVLYYTGMRIGELLALTLADIDLQECKITINKSFQRLRGQDVITPPKTPKSNRIVTIPEFLRDELQEYISKLYHPKQSDRLFPYTKSFFEHEMIRGIKHSGVKKIRLHDIRHSHASLLVEMGCTPLLIADRLGHEKIETTLNTYSHLYPHKQNEIAQKLQNLK